MNCANHPDRERVAFCQDCGKPLCQECTRTIGTAVYCEQSLAARLGGAVPPPPGPMSEGAPAGAPYTYPVGGPVPPLPGEPNPGLAALLGFIPGVGAMYNGQYAKGVVHLIVFAILVSLSHENGIFGMFVAGWIFYQVIEAHHTARARRDGTPLPNPFGLNDLSERMGFGKAWPGTASASQPYASQTTPPPADPAAASTGIPYTPPASYQQPTQAPPHAANWSAPWESYAPPVPPVPPYGVPPYGTPGYPPPIYPASSFTADPNLPVPRNRFPAGAVWLIGLGCVFLIGNSGLFYRFPIHRIVPFLIIGLGVWLFVHKMTETGSGLADDGSPVYQYRLFRALRGSIWIVLVGVMFLLDSFDILSWAHSWPLFLLVAGLMAIFQRFSFNAAATASYPYPPPAVPVPSSPASTSIVPSIVPSNDQHDQEGK